MKRLIKSLALFAAIVIAFLALPLLFVPRDTANLGTPASQTLPWQVDIQASGFTQVFGITPGVSSLAEAQARLGETGLLGLVIAPGETGALECYFENYSAAGVTGKVILTLESTLEEREALLQRARKAEYMKGTTRRIDLAEEDIAKSKNARVLALTFLPSANLTEDVVTQRFGQPDQRIRIDEEAEHFLYPKIGLDILLNAKGKEVLQYVAPADFQRLILARLN